MATQLNQNASQFVPHQHYKFDPPVETNCIPTADGRWERKKFAGGTCLRYEPRENAFAFIGKPVGEDVDHFFYVEWGSGSFAEEVVHPHLYAAK